MTTEEDSADLRVRLEEIRGRRERIESRIAAHRMSAAAGASRLEELRQRRDRRRGLLAGSTAATSALGALALQAWGASHFSSELARLVTMPGVATATLAAAAVSGLTMVVSAAGAWRSGRKARSLRRDIREGDRIGLEACDEAEALRSQEMAITERLLGRRIELQERADEELAMIYPVDRPAIENGHLTLGLEMRQPFDTSPVSRS